MSVTYESFVELWAAAGDATVMAKPSANRWIPIRTKCLRWTMGLRVPAARRPTHWTFAVEQSCGVTIPAERLRRSEERRTVEYIAPQQPFAISVPCGAMYSTRTEEHTSELQSR